MADLHVIKPKPKTDEEIVRGQSYLEFLESFVQEIRDGKIDPHDVMIFWIDPENRPHYWTKQVSVSLQIAYGALIQEMGIAEWRK